MGWLTKILRGSKGHHHHGKYGNHSSWHNYSEDADFDEDEINCAIALSLSVVDQKGKKVIEDKSPSEDDEEPARVSLQEDEELERARQEEERLVIAWQQEEERLARAQEEERLARARVEEEERLARAREEEEERLHRAKLEEDECRRRAQLEEDEQLAKILQESLDTQSPPQYDNGNMFRPFPFSHLSGFRICSGCDSEIGHGRFLSCMGGVWHPECFRCNACDQPITDYEFSMSGNRPYHKSCYKEQHHPRCDVCRSFIPTNAMGVVEYRAHRFWLQKYCPSHERDGTPRCCSCERMEPRDTKFLSLDDGRKLCLECLDSAIMDTHECQPLYLEIQEFYEGLNMKVGQQVPMLLVERQALNEAMEGEKNGHHHMPETRGLCLSEEQTVTTIRRRPIIGAGYRIMDMITEPCRLIRQCEVTAILVLYGLPRLLTGSILAHEMMHAWLRLKGYPNLSPEVEEGICQVLAHMWLESELYSSAGSDVPSTSSSSTPSSSKKGKRSEFEKKLGEFFKHQIEKDISSAYGEGFRMGNEAVLKYGLRRTLDHIKMTGSFP